MRLIFLTAVIFLLCVSNVSAKTLQEGMALYKLGNYPQAETIFRQIISKNPSDYTAQYMLAVTLVKTQRYNEAAGLYKNVIARSGNDSLVSLCRTGLNNIGQKSATGPANTVSRAILNVNIESGVIVINDVMLNNSLRTRFYLDTGASYTMISRNTAAKLNISTTGVPTVPIMTGSGYINAPLVKIPEIEVKGMVARNVEAIVADLPTHSSGKAGNLAGLLGLSFLENFVVSVDRANNVVILEKN